MVSSRPTLKRRLASSAGQGGIELRQRPDGVGRSPPAERSLRHRLAGAVVLLASLSAQLSVAVGPRCSNSAAKLCCLRDDRRRAQPACETR
jgi:hypothetical protein